MSGADYFDVVIRRAEDGVERTYRMEGCGWKLGEDGDDNLFWWEDGNGACDCNRGDMFHRAAGEPVDGDEPCGDTRYLVIRFVLPDGRIVKGTDV